MSEVSQGEQTSTQGFIRGLRRAEGEPFSRLAWELARRCRLDFVENDVESDLRATVYLADGDKVWGTGHTTTEAMRDLAIQLDRWNAS